MSSGMWDVVFFDLLRQMGGEDVKPRTLSWFALKVKPGASCDKEEAKEAAVECDEDDGDRACPYALESMGQYAARRDFMPGLLAFLARDGPEPVPRLLYVALHEPALGGPAVLVFAYNLPSASPEDKFIKFATSHYFYSVPTEKYRQALEYPPQLLHAATPSEVEAAILGAEKK